MRKLIAYTAATADGFIARNDGSIDWLTGMPNPDNDDFGYSAFVAGIDTALMGRVTFEVVSGFGDPFPYVGLTNYVFSRRPHEAHAHVQWVATDPAAFVRTLKAQSGKSIWLIGGGRLNAVLLEAGLIDELIVSVVPHVLGSGIGLFQGALTDAPLTLLGHRAFANGLVQLHYAVNA